MNPLRHELSLRNAWRFPLQSEASRRDLILGALWLAVPIVGWLMNLGHRIRVVHNLHHGRPAWPAFVDAGDLLYHGALTFAGMAYYGAPGVATIALGAYLSIPALVGVGLALFIAAVIAIPGYMSHYCKELDPREIFDPFRALRRVREGGLAYWKAWSIVLPTMLFSFVGLFAFGVGFLVTSVWFWQVAAFCFASVFTQRFDLDGSASSDPRAA